MDGLTLGVEEEYFLLHPLTGRPLPWTDRVRKAAGLQPAISPGEVQQEMLRCQVEIATPVCHELAEVGGHLLRLRHSLAHAAESVGCRLAACGTAPFAPVAPVPVSADARYRALHADAPQLVGEQLICGMHVHVGVPGREAQVAVLNELRPWLPVLTALSADSPLWHGGDTGFASWRTIVFSRWPVAGIPPEFADAADYDRRIHALVEHGMIRDLGQLYWQARLSDRYPTIEVRAMDVQLRADEAVLMAGLVRALVATALNGRTGRTPTVPRPPESLAAAAWHAARHGTDDQLHHPRTARLHKVGDIVADLVRHIRPALQDSGDERQVTSLLHRLLQEGNGAHRQRRALATGGPRELLRMITEAGTAA
ncbi:glutamate--cysteine ligase [Kitasatospora terrestris]|uniref:Putative glutamate--cysteine ligase 2 n=1 Tax=Kitasatospora terrestris TaxID=258051 RepID=A0ABP9DAQ0_9ACTN